MKINPIPIIDRGKCRCVKGERVKNILAPVLGKYFIFRGCKWHLHVLRNCGKKGEKSCTELQKIPMIMILL